uniref:Small CPxCG-related zinc finger protein n=1 Tax=Mycena chlorophos TaxID=658473 RepID=A0ABQ0KX44_MYCCL|nr:predicted protein [Mycena chlorophos]
MLVCGKCGDEGARPRIRRRGFDALDTVVVPYCQECMDGEWADGHGSRVQWAELEEMDGEEEDGEEDFVGLFSRQEQ